MRNEEQVRVAHLVHRCLRAEANADGADLTKTLRAPDLHVGRKGDIRSVLPTYIPSRASDFYELVRLRRSTPVFDFEPLPLDQLAAVLKMSLSSKGIDRAYQRRDIPRRVFPSAGGLQDIDVQVLAHNVAGLDRGRYEYDPLDHSLVLAETGDFRAPIVEASFATNWLMHAQCVIAIVGNYERVSWKYGTRGYRYMGIDAGVVCGQLYLAATALGLAVNAVAAFQDDATNRLLRLDGKDHFVQLLVAVGNKPGRQE
ncbi:SagB/ThcOx family dehydrogenase [Gleimia hominis]|uniref:SagB/ThcOx family dehydrogenase n=1 Tax=Gleimia hominis TaxID=595468 RepID=UPI002543EF2F|nr:SagB/ThcOx family dehydrogenase [Gleimia hominis]WIK64422.1 SagB/ThcOx family dehydrogenase [Gleimia hominis]